MKELKELLKPPFVFGGNYKWDWDTYHIRADMDCRETAILKVMPIADHGYYRNLLGDEGWQKFIKDLSVFTAAAMNEKWERDFSEPMRWIVKRAIVRCPKCDFGAISYSSYCPSCGQRLLPPEEIGSQNESNT